MCPKPQHTRVHFLIQVQPRGACVCAQSLPSYLTLCNPVDSCVRGILQVRILEWAAMPLLQGIFPTQGYNLHFLWLLHCRWVFCPLSHVGSPQPGSTGELSPGGMGAGRFSSLLLQGESCDILCAPWASKGKEPSPHCVAPTAPSDRDLQIVTLRVSMYKPQNL